MIARVVRMVVAIGVLRRERQIGRARLRMHVMGAAAHNDVDRQHAGGDDRHDLPGKSHVSHILSVSKYRPHNGIGQVKL